MYDIRPVDDGIRNRAMDLITKNWGAPIIVTKGKIHSAESLPGFIVIEEGEIKGLVTYHIENRECEIVSLNSLVENKGLGTELIEKVIEKATSENCSRVWLITTNDNTKAIHFYQKRGFDLVAIYLNTVKKSRKIKPQIPEYGFDGIPILHEIEFEKKL